MAGTINGGRKAAITNKTKYGKDFYAAIGAKGGKRGKTGGFASDKVGVDGLTGRERARVAGSKGGTISRRRSKVFEVDAEEFDRIKSVAFRVLELGNNHILVDFLGSQDELAKYPDKDLIHTRRFKLNDPSRKT